MSAWYSYPRLSDHIQTYHTRIGRSFLFRVFVPVVLILVVFLLLRYFLQRPLQNLLPQFDIIRHQTHSANNIYPRKTVNV